MVHADSFLIQFTVALVKKKAIFLITFLSVFLLSLGLFLLKSPTYQYVTLIKLAHDGDGALLESREDVRAAIERQWLPLINEELVEDQSDAARLGVRVSGVGEKFILLTSVAPAARNEVVRQLHNALTAQVIASQAESVRAVREKLQSQIEAAEKVLNASERKEDSAGAQVEPIKYLVSLKGKIIGVQSAETRVLAQQDGKTPGLGIKMATAVAFIQSLIAAAVMVLLVYFVQRVKSVIQSEQKLT